MKTFLKSILFSLIARSALVLLAACGGGSTTTSAATTPTAAATRHHERAVLEAVRQIGAEDFFNVPAHVRNHLDARRRQRLFERPRDRAANQYVDGHGLQAFDARGDSRFRQGLVPSAPLGAGFDIHHEQVPRDIEHGRDAALPCWDR